MFDVKLIGATLEPKPSYRLFSTSCLLGFMS